MSLKLHNTLTKTIEDFSPQHATKVTLYTCGPTVYNYLQIGNWFAYVMWDILVRTLVANGYSVERVLNITDVGHLVSDEDEGEDKLEKGAKREGKNAWEIAEFYSEDFLKGMEQLGMIMPEHIVRATDFIPQQLDLIRVLKQKGYTYQISDGIYFDTSKFPTYANFASLDLAAQKAGARIEFNPEKHNPSDFALWKFTPKDEKRDMEWETPSDLLTDSPHDSSTPIMGFPGWHLECSAMAMNILGNTIDIHTGGIDHIPVHHTNEIAQSEAASGEPFARFWLHNNHMKSEGTKISKSLGNGYTLQDLMAHGFSALDFRMLALQSQYSNESNFTWEILQAAKNRLRHWRSIAALRHQTHDTLHQGKPSEKTPSLFAANQTILAALNDNLNTPEALAVIDDAFSRLDGQKLADIHEAGLEGLLETIDELLGLQLLPSTPDISDETKQHIIERQRARDNKDWDTSDKLRDKLEEQGIAVRDTTEGSIWYYL